MAFDPFSLFTDAAMGAGMGALGAVGKDVKPVVDAAAAFGAPPPQAAPPPAPAPTSSGAPFQVPRPASRVIHLVPKKSAFRRYLPIALAAGAGLAIGAVALAVVKR